jgi:Family of unknown function (DUF6069)
MTYPPPPNDGGNARVRPDPGQFWAGAAATAVVAALIALVGILICRWTLGIPILAPAGDGAWGSAHSGEYVVGAVCVTIVAAALLYLLVLATPSPGMFFAWIMGLVTLAAVVYPFSTSAPFEQKAATAVVDLVLGIAITSLLAAVAARAVRVQRDGFPPSGPRSGPPSSGPPRSRPYGPTEPIDRPPTRAPGDWR